MDSSRRHALFAGLVGMPLSATLASIAWGQQPQQSSQKQQAGDASASNDAPLAACLLIDGRKQIGKCEMVRKRLQTEEARAFAQAEIEEHERIAKQLMQQGFTFPAAAAADQPGGGAPRPSSAPSSTPTTAQATGGAGQLSVGRGMLPPGAAQIIKTEQEVGEQCLATFKSVIERKEGIKLDKSFIGDQLHAHYMLWDKGQVFKKNASAEMKPILEDGLAVIQKHITTLEGLMDKLDLARS